MSVNSLRVYSPNSLAVIDEEAPTHYGTRIWTAIFAFILISVGAYIGAVLPFEPLIVGFGIISLVAGLFMATKRSMLSRISAVPCYSLAIGLLWQTLLNTTNWPFSIVNVSLMVTLPALFMGVVYLFYKEEYARSGAGQVCYPGLVWAGTASFVVPYLTYYNRQFFLPNQNVEGAVAIAILIALGFWHNTPFAKAKSS